jgi:ATP-dependent helicase HepA
LAQLVAAVGDARTDVAARLEQGRDRLLEWNSFRPETAARLIDEIHREDEDRTLETFMLAVFDLYFIEVEDVAPRTYRLGSAGVLRDTFPGLTSDGLTITSDRQRALAREDLQFLTWDHPLVTGALDRLLGSEHGNCSFARWVDATTSGLYVEAVYMLECIAPPHVHVDRFLPPTPVRVMVDHRGHEAGHALPPQSVTSRATGGEGRAVLARPDVRDTLLPRLIERTRRLADLEVGAIVARAREDMHARLEQETSRLRDLQKVNRSVRDEEIDTLVEQQTALDDYIGTARLRLDALRLVHRGPLY